MILSTPGLTSFAQAQANMVDVGVYTVINLSASDQLFLYNVDPFSSPPTISCSFRVYPSEARR